MSSLAWIDFDEAERQRTQRIMALFDVPGTRDELGLGGIRDSIADKLFPGTSTIQTRLRYMLFIPWIFQTLESSTAQPDQLAKDARSRELQLALALGEGGESTGIIGQIAGANLKRLPSSVYWAGLESWGIRLFPGSIDNYFSSIRRLQKLEADQNWTPALPSKPENLLSTASFKLTIEEAEFIKDRLVARHPQSLLTFLARNQNSAADCVCIWEHPNFADFPEKIKIIVDHAEMFSNVINGASLLYNLLLSQMRENDEWVERYQTRLKEWQDSLDRSAIKKWSLDDFWNEIEHPTHIIPIRTKNFVSEWQSIVIGNNIQKHHAADLVQIREQWLKKRQSRFTNQAVRDRWMGASGAEPLTFRWAQAKSHLQDLANAQ